MWKFKNSLLGDDDLKKRISFYYPQIHEKYTDVKDKQLQLIKMEVRIWKQLNKEKRAP